MMTKMHKKVVLRKIFEAATESQESTARSFFDNEPSDIPFYMPLYKLQQIHPFFRKFTVEAVSCILQMGRILILQPQQILYRQLDEQLNIYLVIYGWLELIHNPDLQSDQLPIQADLLIIDQDAQRQTKQPAVQTNP